MKNVLTLLLLLITTIAIAQTKVDLQVENDGNTEQYKLRLEKEVNGETVVTEKTYSSKEEMKNDPELKDIDLHFMDGSGSSFKNKNGNVLIEIDEEGGKSDHKLMFISESSDEGDDISIEVKIDEDGTKHVIKNGKEVDLEELHEDGEKMFVLRTEHSGDKLVEEKMEVEVTVDEDGTHHVTVNGEEVDYEEWKQNNELHTGSKNIEWIEKGEDGKHIKKEIIIINKEDDTEDVKVEVIVKNIVLHLEEINNEDEKVFSLENNRQLKLDKFNFYPNPSNGTFQLTFEGKDRPTTIKVSNINGKEMYAEKLNDFTGTYNKEISLPGLKKGIYLLQVVQGSKAVNKKIVIE
jgi:type IX secretion system substrate protein